MADRLRRNTHQRQVVLEELQEPTSPPMAFELHEIARQRLPKISLGTVCRNLDVLADVGLIRRPQAGGAEACHDGNAIRCYHVRCLLREQVDDAHGPSEDPLANEVKTLSGYAIHGFQLEFVSLCPGCGSRSGSPV